MKNEQASWRETFRLHIRCLRDVYRIAPGHVLSMMFHDLLFSLHPYLSVWLSAQVVMELAGLRRPEHLVKWVVIVLITETLVHLLRYGLERWEHAQQNIFSISRDRLLYAQKFLSMDYSDLDRQATHDQFAQVEQADRSGGWGINRGLYFMDVLFSSVIGLIGAVVMTAGLFAQNVENQALSFLDHPLAAVGVLCALGAAVFFSAVFEVRAVRTWAQINEQMRFGNRCFRIYSSWCAEQGRAADIRMYRQAACADAQLEKHDTFGKDSLLAKKERGSIGVFSGISDFLASIFTGIVYVFVCLKAWGGAFGVGAVTQYVGAFSKVNWHVSRFIQAFGNMRSNTAFLRALYEFLDIPSGMYEGACLIEKRENRRYDVEFRDVSFRYPGTDKWALRHVNVRFKVGSRLAVVGENGSGKTTFIKLLCRLYDPQEGQILLDGLDIRKYDYRDYMDLFAVVFQDFQLLSQPLGANVAGSEEYDPERVRRSLIDAGFADRLDSMSLGLDTQLYRDFGDGGVEVSGGEAQKIAIARALYKDAPFIILDEPTASLDPVAEAEIYARFNEISGDRTSVYISHRLSSCKFCDEIMVFYNGEVIQQGSHEALLSDLNGKYHALWNAQAQYYTA